MSHAWKRGRVMLAAAVAITGAGASAAQASTVTVTGDDGNPLPLAQGVPGAIRNLAPTVGISFPPTQARFSATVTGPDGVAVASPLTCFTTSTGWTRSVGYRGNGAYTVTIANYAYDDRNCATPTATETFVFAINGSVGIAPPAGVFLIRKPNSFSTNTLQLPVALNPGAGTYELRYAAGGVVGPDGAISGPSSTAYVNQTTGLADLTFRDPGTYTVVARASSGQYSTPWSPAVTVDARSPFDLNSLTFTDSRGPKYRIRGAIREDLTRGRVSISIARGKASGRYRSLGSVKISSKGTFTKGFSQSRTGTYRIKVTFKGSATTVAGSVTSLARFSRRVIFG